MASSAYKHFYSPANAAFYNGGHYKPLDPAKQEIRLLQIEKTATAAASPDSAAQPPPLSLKLVQPVPLSEAGPFIAVSYCAGDPGCTVPVLVDGVRFNAFASLGGALARIAERISEGDDGRGDEDGELDWSSMSVWADQVCINQSYPSEKAQQVQLMRHIYESSAMTFSWLGSDPQISAGLRAARTLAAMQLSKESSLVETGVTWQDFEQEDDDAHFEYILELIERLIHDKFDWESLAALFAAPYWRRGWITQELVVPPRLKVGTNHEEVDRKILQAANRAANGMYSALTVYFDAVDDGDGSRQLALSSRGMGHVHHNTLTLLIPKTRGLTWMLEHDHVLFDMLLDRDHWVDSGGFKLVRLVLHARQCQVADPLDRVYAFLGLAKPEHKAGVIPDYSSRNTVEDAYIQAAKAEITAGSSLDILVLATERSLEFGRDIGRLPSWVPDWGVSVDKDYYSLLFWGVDGGRADSYICSSLYSFSPDPTTGRQDHVLHCNAIVVDCVAESPAYLSQTPSFYGDLGEWLASCAMCAGLSLSEGMDSSRNSHPYPHTPGQSKIDAFWHIILRSSLDPKDIRAIYEREERSEDIPPAGMKFSSPPSPPLGSECSDLVRHSSPNSATPDARVIAERPFSSFTKGNRNLAKDATDYFKPFHAKRRFFSSPKEYYGLLPSRALPDDIICILLGSVVPFILRPDGNGHYFLMGIAYVHGIMFGEVVDALDRGEGGWKIERIQIR